MCGRLTVCSAAARLRRELALRSKDMAPSVPSLSSQAAKTLSHIRKRASSRPCKLRVPSTAMNPPKHNKGLIKPLRFRFLVRLVSSPRLL